jgi:hypothetical protein
MENANKDDKVNIPAYQMVNRNDSVFLCLRNFLKNIPNAPYRMNQLFIEIPVNFIP